MLWYALFWIVATGALPMLGGLIFIGYRRHRSPTTMNLGKALVATIFVPFVSSMGCGVAAASLTSNSPWPLETIGYFYGGIAVGNVLGACILVFILAKILRVREGLCKRCGCDLSSSVTGRCPDCGQALSGE